MDVRLAEVPLTETADSVILNTVDSKSILNCSHISITQMAVMIFVRLAISLFCRERYSPRILLEVMWYSIHDLAERLNGWVCTDWVVALLGRLSSISRVEPGRETRGRLMLFCLEGVLCLLVDLYMLLISTERVLNCLLY